MQRVFVLDAQRRHLMPCRPARARLLSPQRKAAVHRRFPLALILATAHPDSQVQPLRMKVDPGSRATGVAVVNDVSGDAVWAAEITHRGRLVKERLDQRHTRYRKPRFANRRRRAGVPNRSAKAGVHVGRIAMRATGSRDIKTTAYTIQGIHFRSCQPLHRSDGYTYT
jgi:hypothetical protein